MKVRNGQTLVSRKTGRDNVKVVVLRKDVATLLDTETGRRWTTRRENLRKSFTTA